MESDEAKRGVNRRKESEVGGTPAGTPFNQEARIARIAFWLMIGFVVAGFVPGFSGMDMMRGGFAVVAGCVFLGLASGVTWVLFRRRAHILDRFLKGRDVLAKWEIPAGIWAKHVAEDLKEEKEGKKRDFSSSFPSGPF